ncbi:MAG TPA: histidine kinase famiy protein [Burkholderiaceae bacterium]|nr:histidine kinase famiy protein [Burkholderiaceae bacterium]
MSDYDPLQPVKQSRRFVEVDTDSFSSEGEGRDIFFAAVETTRMPMIVTDPRQPDNPIVFANEAFMSMTGYSADELIGRNCRFLQGPETSKASVDEVRKAVAEEREIAIEILNYRKDGGSFWNALFISPVRNRDGELIYFFASQLDVSRRRDAEDALHQAQKMEALGQLTGGIAHDFNNLLQVVVGHAEIVRLRAEALGYEDAQLVKSINSIRDATKKATTLTQHLLAFARKQQLQGRVINLNALTMNLTELAKRTLGTDIELVTQLQDDIWNCRVDSTQAEVALLNILINARDAMKGRGGRVKITTSNIDIAIESVNAFSVPAPGPYVCITVADNGPGIPSSILPRVMDPFFTTKAEGEGTGLGLSMVYGFAKQSGGAATIYSEEGFGTTVRMYFPATGESIRSPEKRRVSGVDCEGHERILIVDDRAEVAEMSELMLSGLGYQTRRCTSAAQALTMLAQEGPFDLLLTDLIMPGSMNGVMLARRALQEHPSLRVLLTTGFADRTIDRGDTEQFDIIFKPYTQLDLGRRVRVVLDGATGAG